MANLQFRERAFHGRTPGSAASTDSWARWTMKRPIYMDIQATTPVDPRVLDAMLPYFTERFGNASSKSHLYGIEADAAIRRAREQVATAIGAQPHEIVFTSGSTESLNLAIRGAAGANRARGEHIVSCVTEHPAVLDTLADLASKGFSITLLPVDAHGGVDLAAFERALTPRTTLAVFMAANNEIGTTHPLRELARIAHAHGVLFATDATQGVGKLPFHVLQDGVDLAAFTGHKMYGPKGVGALYVRRTDPIVHLDRQQHGGGHEHGLRSGTLNVPGIVGLGAAVELAVAELATESARLAQLRTRLADRIQSRLSEVRQNGHPTQRLPGNLSLSFSGIDGEALMMDMPDVALSSGSACHSGSLEPSHVLTAIGLPADLAHGTLRFGLGRFTTQADVDLVSDLVVASVTRLRDLSPLWELRKGR
jgi:cysteine desulfurase